MSELFDFNIFSDVKDHGVLLIMLPFQLESCIKNLCDILTFRLLLWFGTHIDVLQRIYD
jgi:hypothetical protein